MVDPQEHVPLAPLTTFRIGGSARYFIGCRSVEDIRAGLAFADARALPIFILGGGSNVLVADNGFDGLVLKIDLQELAIAKEGAHALVTAGAGVAWDDLVARMVDEGYAGLENMSGVPGTVGGAVVANAGCYGTQLSDTFVSARVIDRERPEKGIVELKKEQCGFSYHDSVFGRERGRYVVLDASFKLAKRTTAHPSYVDSRFDLAARAAKNGRAPTIRDVRSAVLEIRREKGTLAECYRSAGSFFHMPFLPSAAYEAVLARARELDAAKEELLRPWAWRQADGSYKLAPGFLLEYTEFHKGYARGDAGVSPKHTLTLINRGGARASEVAGLARDMQEAVKKIFGIELEREVEYVGAV